MSDPTKFNELLQYYIFNLAILMLLASEIFIFFYTYQKPCNQKINKADKGTKWLLYANFLVCIIVSFYFVSQKSPAVIRKIMFSNTFSRIGISFIIIGIIIRLISVLTLKRAFTLNIQTSSEQHLITNGIYKFIRHPAYSGSIISLIGVALSLRNILSTVLVLMFCLFCYQIRITIEENTLQKHFGDEYIDYKKKTYKLFPYIF